MSEASVDVVLNQQQCELLDHTVEQFPGKSREEILLIALREFCADRGEDVGRSR